VASGRRNKQVAALIGTTEKTVKVHRARVMQKLALASITDLVRLVDYVLCDTSSVLRSGADWRRIHRPRALGVMATALATATAGGADRPSPSLATLRQVCRDAATAAEIYY
jgi:hypothetical protein